MRRRDALALLGGTAMSWPLGARAQQKAMPVIGLLSSTSPTPAAPSLAAFRKGLIETGFKEGENVSFEYRWADNHFDRLPALAADLVQRHVDMIVTFGGPASALAAKQATSTIPVLFNAVGDPIAAGLVASLAHPGGNVTGFSILVVDLNMKRFEILSELVPNVRTIALLINPNTLSSERVMQNVQSVARNKGIRLVVLKAGSQSEIAAVFASLPQQHVDAIHVGSDPSFNNWREQLVTLASRYRVPAIYEFRDSVEIGGLASYGPDPIDFNHQAGTYAGRILKGDKPADLPVQQPTKFELVINLKTAKALGLIIPQSLLARADEVIE